MNKPTEKEIKDALTKTLNAYDELINDVEGNKHKWKNYGISVACHLCNLCDGNISCDECPLYFCNDCNTTETMARMRNVVNKHLLSMIYRQPTNHEIKQAAIARRDWIINKIAESGYVYE